MYAEGPGNDISPNVPVDKKLSKTTNADSCLLSAVRVVSTSCLKQKEEPNLWTTVANRKMNDLTKSEKSPL